MFLLDCIDLAAGDGAGLAAVGADFAAGAGLAGVFISGGGTSAGDPGLAIVDAVLLRATSGPSGPVTGLAACAARAACAACPSFSASAIGKLRVPEPLIPKKIGRAHV